MKLSVIIVNYNVQHFLEQCLYSVYSSIRGMDADVYVVDNTSVDGSVNMIKQKFPGVKLIENKENVGFSIANNQAIQASNAEYVLLLNPDTVVEEDTLAKCVAFMDEHQDAGGLGVKMVDGKGKFLPESKRGLPTPKVAFYKISGLSRLFPRSKRFAGYHLGYLPDDETHEIEIMSGAFMMLRKKVLDKVGLLDEEYFMYGEDIDMSYRIIKGGYKNYYFPEARIIHYKGESTKKSSVNYVFVFYRAMIIFARKHFSAKHARSFAAVINLAIYVRAFIALMNRFVRKAAVPALDALLLVGGLFVLKSYYTEFTGIVYRDGLVNIALPGYGLIWLLSVFFTGGYDSPLKPFSIIKGIVIGSGIILIMYSLLPESYRFSRALILLGAAWTVISFTITRIILHLLRVKGFIVKGAVPRRFVVVANEQEAERISSLILQTADSSKFLGVVSPGDSNSDSFIGNKGQLSEIIDVHKVNEIIFSAKDMSAQETIDLMTRAHRQDIEYKIAPPESLYLIGSNSIDQPTDLYVHHIKSIDRKENVRSKRFLDIGVSLLFLSLSPLAIWFVKNKMGFIANIFRVLAGKRTWVGYANLQGNTAAKLPRIKAGVISPLQIIGSARQTDESLTKMNLIYAKDYKVATDLHAMWSNFSYLGS